MKHLLFSFFALLIAVSSYAYDVEIDGIYYNIDANTKKSTVTYQSGSYYTGSIVIPETIVAEGVTYDVSTIGEKAFYACNNLTSVTIPKSVTSILKDAFNMCM